MHYPLSYEIFRLKAIFFDIKLFIVLGWKSSNSCLKTSDIYPSLKTIQLYFGNVGNSRRVFTVNYLTFEVLLNFLMTSSEALTCLQQQHVDNAYIQCIPELQTLAYLHVNYQNTTRATQYPKSSSNKSYQINKYPPGRQGMLLESATRLTRELMVMVSCSFL